MAARTLKPHHQDDVRRKIQVSQIINRFQDALEGKIELTAVQVSCGKVLLDKSLSNLTSTEITGEVNHTINKIEIEIVDSQTAST
jgi:hypothetical protein